jgi:hypothetical protein
MTADQARPPQSVSSSSLWRPTDTQESRGSQRGVWYIFQIQPHHFATCYDRHKQHSQCILPAVCSCLIILSNESSSQVQSQLLVRLQRVGRVHWWGRQHAVQDESITQVVFQLVGHKKLRMQLALRARGLLCTRVIRTC